MTKFWVGNAHISTTDDVGLALAYVNEVPSWIYWVTKAMAGPTPYFYHSLDPQVDVLPAGVGWTDVLVNEHAVLFGMRVTVVELDDDVYSKFITRIESRSIRASTKT